jgi:hypothetical protein
VHDKSTPLVQGGTIETPTTKSLLHSGKSVLEAERHALLQRFAERHSKMVVDGDAATEQSTGVTPKLEFPASNNKVEGDTSSDDSSESIIWEDESSESDGEEAAGKSKDQSFKEKIKTEALLTGQASTETAKLQRR